MEKWDHVEIGHLREAPPVLVLEHVAYRYALLIQSGIILTLTEHLGIFAFSCVARNLIAIEIVIIQVILQGVRLQNVLALTDEWLSDLELSGGEIKNAVLTAAFRAATKGVLLDSEILYDSGVSEASAAGRVMRRYDENIDDMFS